MAAGAQGTRGDEFLLTEPLSAVVRGHGDGSILLVRAGASGGFWGTVEETDLGRRGGCPLGRCTRCRDLSVPVDRHALVIEERQYLVVHEVRSHQSCFFRVDLGKTDIGVGVDAVCWYSGLRP